MSEVVLDAAQLENAPKFEKMAFLLAEKSNTTIQKTEVMTGDNQSRNINIHGSVSQSVVNADDNNTLTQQINHLDDTDAQQQLKTLLLQLESAINAEPSMSEVEKAEALEEVKEIAVAGQAPDDGPMKAAAKRSLNVLKGMTVGVGSATKFVEACNGLLPAIALLFGL